jgi:hypothetical protein
MAPAEDITRGQSGPAIPSGRSTSNSSHAGDSLVMHEGQIAVPVFSVASVSIRCVG